MKKQIIYRVAGFGVIFFVLLYVLTVLLMPKPTKELAINTSSSLGFYHEPENTIDVLYIGSSHTFCSFSPIDIFHNYGITGYVRGSSCQKIWASETVLEDSLRTQNPKVVVFEVMMMFDLAPQTEAFNREIYDSLRPSNTKYQGVATTLEKSTDEDFLSYVFPIMRYHDRWSTLEKDDFTFFQESRHMVTKGYFPRQNVVPVTDYNPGMYQISDMEPYQYTQETIEYLQRMKNLCDERGIAFVMVKAPTHFSYFWDGSKSLAATQIAEQLGVPYIDFNIGEYAELIDWDTESLDGGNHINYAGAMKVSNEFGEWLTSHFSFEDKRIDPKYEVWNTDYEIYEKELALYTIKNATTFEQYMETMLKNDLYKDYLLVISSKEDALNQITQNQSQLLSNIGNTLTYEQGGCAQANLFMSYQGNVLVQEQSDGELMVSMEQSGHHIELTSQPLYGGNYNSVIIDGVECSKNKRGLDIVIYDLENNKLVDSAVFDYTENSQFIRVPD